MEPSDDLSLSRPSPRRELQGPRPTPLKVRKDSHKIKKPPPAAAAAAAPPAQSRPPVIIYTVSPKVIHANRSEFMSLVQRLTGPTAPPSSASAIAAAGGGGGGVALEKTAPLGGGDRVLQQLGIEGVVPSSSGRATGFFPAGILSPVPSSLPPVAPELFVTGANADGAAAVQNPLNFFNELSPSFNGNKSGGFVENAVFLPFSPNYNNNFISTPILPSPGACWDLFNQNHGF